MRVEPWGPLLASTADRAADHLDRLGELHVAPTVAYAELIDRFGGPLPADGCAPQQVVDELVAGVQGGLNVMNSPRFFGWVIGGSLPAALAADWLTATWEQNAAMAHATPAAMAVEQVAAAWVLEALGLPAEASVGFVTGGQMANFTCLAAARDRVLREHGWDVEEHGLQGAPPVHVFAGAEWHDTVPRALRLLGLGSGTARLIETDDQGRLRPDLLAAALEEVDGPTIVVAQAGNVHSGCVDPLADIADAVAEHREARSPGAWLHIDGAFGLWAAASRRRRALLDGYRRADSWGTDAHKWLNVPYDCGVAICADARAHHRAMSLHAAYLPPAADATQRDAMDVNPEMSRRARGFAVWAALRQLGRAGVEALVDRCCDAAERFARSLDEHDDIEIVNDVVLNQVLVSFGSDERTRAVSRALQADGTAFAHDSTWHDRAVLRISVSNWATDADEVDRSVDAILRCVAGLG